MQGKSIWVNYYQLALISPFQRIASPKYLLVAGAESAGQAERFDRAAAIGIEENDSSCQALLRSGSPIKQDVFLGYIKRKLHWLKAHLRTHATSLLSALLYAYLAVPEREAEASHVQLRSKRSHS
ncbi:MAG: hypothetical protein EOO56_20605 [Hymenobacter sp.]|nr:MAG: hypothetical protein EOO56_20605 [Hymenobacter sp.]